MSNYFVDARSLTLTLPEGEGIYPLLPLGEGWG